MTSTASTMICTDIPGVGEVCVSCELLPQNMNDAANQICRWAESSAWVRQPYDDMPDNLSETCFEVIEGFLLAAPYVTVASANRWQTLMSMQAREAE